MVRLFNFKPKQLLFIAIDGVAPRAKMEQQRKRRYRSSLEKKMINEILMKNNQKIKKNWDTNAIKPGTLFMLKLSHFLQKNLKKYMVKSPYFKKSVKIILSDTNRVGEGEHKIVQFIRGNELIEKNINCIYGLDADLIMLSMCLNSKIYLLREGVHFGKINLDELLYFSIEYLKKYIFNEVKEHFDCIEDEFEIEQEKIINDYILLCFLLGNDFLPHLINLDIANNDIQKLLNIYINIEYKKNIY